jgi:hypothetical protein
MDINHGGSHIFMAQKFLHRSDIISAFNQVRGKRMPERVTCRSFSQMENSSVSSVDATDGLLSF